jgi:threonine/homoserine/homoserine lactone efflux protein
MDFLILFLKGALIGCAIAAPVGPVGILCIRQTLSRHAILATVIGLGSACADVFYGSIAVFGLVGISNFMTSHDFYLRLFGGIIVGGIGLSVMRTPPLNKAEAPKGLDSPFHAFMSSFILTISNPITLLVFAAAFTALGISPHDPSLLRAVALITGVFMGAICWWLSLIFVIHLLKHKLSETQLFWINRVSGVVLIGFSVYILVSLV